MYVAQLSIVLVEVVSVSQRVAVLRSAQLTKHVYLGPVVSICKQIPLIAVLVAKPVAREKAALMDHADAEVQPLLPGAQPVLMKKPAAAVLQVVSLLTSVLAVL